MRRARLRMHGALGDFLAEERRGVDFDVAFELPVGLRDLIQSTGVPHVEVGRVVVDGEDAGWSEVIGGGSRVEAYPRYPLAAPPPDARFLLDVHLGKLASFLRLVGLDADHDPAADDPTLVRRSTATSRILLTRDRGLLMHGALRDGCYVRATEPPAQAVEVVERFALRSLLAPFTRCMVCNCPLSEVAPAEVADRVPASVARRYDEFRRCGGCNRVYWPGSHHVRLQRLVERIRGTQSRDSPSPDRIRP